MSCSAADEQEMLITTRERPLGRHRERPALAASPEGPISGASRSLERRNERNLLIGWAAS
jgi:hypothetical protein